MSADDAGREHVGGICGTNTGRGMTAATGGFTFATATTVFGACIAGAGAGGGVWSSAITGRNTGGATSGEELGAMSDAVGATCLCRLASNASISICLSTVDISARATDTELGLRDGAE